MTSDIALSLLDRAIREDDKEMAIAAWELSHLDLILNELDFKKFTPDPEGPDPWPWPFPWPIPRVPWPPRPWPDPGPYKNILDTLRRGDPNPQPSQVLSAEMRQTAAKSLAVKLTKVVERLENEAAS